MQIEEYTRTHTQIVAQTITTKTGKKAYLLRDNLKKVVCSVEFFVFDYGVNHNGVCKKNVKLYKPHFRGKNYRLGNNYLIFALVPLKQTVLSFASKHNSRSSNSLQELKLFRGSNY